MDRIHELYNGYKNGRVNDARKSGALVQGRTHSQGGIPIFQAGGTMGQPQEIAEIEGTGQPGGDDAVVVDGGERVTSTDDTAQLDQMVDQVLQTQDPQQQQQLLMSIGAAYVAVVQKQRQQNPSATQSEDPDRDAFQAMMSGGGGQGEEEAPTLQ
jgi:hypothetical protein